MKNVVIVDIDGVLADYRLGLLWWINTHYPELRETCYKHLSVINTWINHKSMGISYREWLDILERFRHSGGKLTIPEFPGAKNLMDFLEEKKYRAVLVTSRPFDIYSNIYKDTLEWLKEKHFKYHLLLFSKSKSDVIYKLRLVDDVVFTIDDEVQHVQQYVDLGLKSYWLNHYGAKLDHYPEHLIQVSNLNEILEKEKKDETIKN